MIFRLGRILCGVAVLAILAGCAQRPPIADGLISHSDWYHWDGATQRFSAAVQNKFPPGSDEAAMIRTLLHQGFEYPPPAWPGCIPQKDQRSVPMDRAYVPCPNYDPKHRLIWGRPLMGRTDAEGVGRQGFCREVLWVDWSAANGRIISIKGVYSGSCSGGF